MKLDRRSFIRLVPLGLAAALAGGSWWFFREVASGPMIESEATVTTTSEASQTTVATTPETSQASVTTTTEASQGTVEASKAFDFPVTWNGDQPTKVNLHDYRLKVDGDVSNPLDLALDDLRAMSSVQRTLNIGCVLGWAADVPWEGIPLSHLLSLAGAPAKIAHVTVESVTGYTMTMGPDEVANPDNMIALKAGGVPLTVEHGYPARLVAPTRSGLDWVKYVERITCASK
jgi:DMSO/TMAO reductase YedYZ molybdopterin-dependent catalytic subunit